MTKDKITPQPSSLNDTEKTSSEILTQIRLNLAGESNESLKKLNTTLNKRSTPEYIKHRIRCVLYAVEPQFSNFSQVATYLHEQSLNYDAHWVKRWLSRFADAGIEGLYDKHRSGRVGFFDNQDNRYFLNCLLQKSPKTAALDCSFLRQRLDSIPLLRERLENASCWSYKLLGEALGVNPKSVAKFMQRNKMDLYARGTVCVSFDSKYEDKLKDIDALYSNKPSDDEVVLCLDEKTCIQAIYQIKYRFKSYKIYSSCRYIRHGVVNLIAALNPHTGKVYHEFLETKTKADILGFITRLRNHPDFRGKTIHIVLDNLSSHLNFGTVDPNWQEKCENVHFHFTPTCASWCNQVESWFSLLTRAVLKGGSWATKESLKHAISKFIGYYNVNLCKPFKWHLNLDRHFSQRRNNLVSLMAYGVELPKNIKEQLNLSDVQVEFNSESLKVILQSSSDSPEAKAICENFKQNIAIIDDGQSVIRNVDFKLIELSKSCPQIKDDQVNEDDGKTSSLTA